MALFFFIHPNCNTKFCVALPGCMGAVGWTFKLSAEIVLVLDNQILRAAMCREYLMQLNWHVHVVTHARACLRSVTTTVKEAMLLASNLGLKTSKACGRLGLKVSAAYYITLKFRYTAR